MKKILTIIFSTISILSFSQKFYKQISEKNINKERLNTAKNFIQEYLKKCENKNYSKFQNFIIDTIRFIKTGKRETSIRSWQIAVKKELTNSHTHVSNKFNFNKEIQDFYRHPANDGKVISVEFNRIICQWLSWRDGHIDLINTLNILFGRLDR